MICRNCEDEGHYWFADDDQEIDPTLEKEIGIYAWCDMRQVFSTHIPECECGCHKGAKVNGMISQLEAVK